MRDLSFIRSEIDRLRLQVGRQRREIVQLKRAGIDPEAGEAMLQRMLTALERLREQRELLKREQAGSVGRRRRGARHA